MPSTSSFSTRTSTLAAQAGSQDPTELEQSLINCIITDDLPTFQSLLSSNPSLSPAFLTKALNDSLRTNKPAFVSHLLTGTILTPFDRFTGLEAIQGGNADSLNLLLSNGMPPYGTGTSGHMTRPIELALTLNNLELVTILLEAGADVDAHEMQIAITHASIDVLKLLLHSDEAKCLVHHGQCGALQFAVEAGRADVVELLLGLPGVDVDSQRWLRGTSALWEAVRHGMTDIVKVLMMVGADPELMSNGRTPVDVARGLEGEVGRQILELLVDESGEEMGERK